MYAGKSVIMLLQLWGKNIQPHWRTGQRAVSSDRMSYNLLVIRSMHAQLGTISAPHRLFCLHKNKHKEVKKK